MAVAREDYQYQGRTVAILRENESLYWILDPSSDDQAVASTWEKKCQHMI